jgi:uncharacterized tellurite resistance protein B-like protein
MSIAQLFESGERTQDKGHFKNLVLIANADGIITTEENDLLVRIGKEIGLDQDQMNEIINNPSQFSIIPPVSKVERFEQIVELIKMIQADGEINEHESRLLESLALALGFKSIDQVDVKKILELLAKGEDTETIVESISK